MTTATSGASCTRAPRTPPSDLGCTLTQTYGSQQQGQAEPDDNAENAQIQNAINAHVDGMAISDHDPSLMNPTIKSAVAKGIPVVLLNAGCDDQDIAASGAITCVGQPEQLAGQAVRCALQAAGRRPTCSASSTSRARTCSTAATASPRASASASSASPATPPSKGPACTELTLSTPNAASNPQQAIGQVTSYLQSHPQINAVMLLNNAIAPVLVNAHPADVKIATFDLSTRRRERDQGGDAGVRGRPAAVPAGLPAHPVPVPVQEARGADRRRRHHRGQRPAPRRQDQHRQRVGGDRRGRRLTHQARHGKPRSCAGRGLARPARPRTSDRRVTERR